MWHSLMNYFLQVWRGINWWSALGMGGNIIFAGRFVVQWLASERAGRSVVPFSFWPLSILGTIIVFIYACYKRDIVFMLAYSLNVFIYVRNIMLIRRHEAVLAAQAAGGENSPPPA